MSPRGVLFSVCFCNFYLASVKCLPSIYYNDNCSDKEMLIPFASLVYLNDESYPSRQEKCDIKYCVDEERKSVLVIPFSEQEIYNFSQYYLGPLF